MLIMYMSVYYTYIITRTHIQYTHCNASDLWVQSPQISSISRYLSSLLPLFSLTITPLCNLPLQILCAVCYLSLFLSIQAYGGNSHEQPGARAISSDAS